MKIRNILAIALAVASVFTAGCKHTPSEETIGFVAEGIGRAAGYAVELGKAKPDVKRAIADVLDIAAKVVPAPDQTFAEVWRPIVDAQVELLVATGKLDPNDAEFVKKALYVACDGVDLVFAKYPTAKEYSNLVSAAVAGFTRGFKSVISLSADQKPDGYDEDAYVVLRARYKAK